MLLEKRCLLFKGLQNSIKTKQDQKWVDDRQNIVENGTNYQKWTCDSRDQY